MWSHLLRFLTLEVSCVGDWRLAVIRFVFWLFLCIVAVCEAVGCGLIFMLLLLFILNWGVVTQVVSMALMMCLL